MFRGFDLKNNEMKFKAVLYKNPREKLYEIDNYYIEKLVRNLEDIDYMEIILPKFIGRDKKFNSIYLKMKPMQHVVVEEINKLGEKFNSRFILSEITKISDKNTGQKRFKAMAFEYKLKDKRTKFEGKVMQLKSDTVHIGEGVLDKFIKEVPDWSIKYVDPKSRIETRLGMENVNVDLFNNYTKNNITDGSIIWEKNVSTNIEDGKPLYLSFEYKNMKTYNADGTLLITNNIINPITAPLYTNVKNIVARHYSDIGNRFGIRYDFTLTDNVIESRIETFTNIIDKNIVCENIKLVWETGDIIENSNIKYINIDSIDDSWYNALIQLQDQFNSVVLFDGFEKSISIIHRDNLGKNSGYLLSYDSNVVDIEVTEESTYPNALKIIGKDGLSIASENIYGGDVIYNYEYYIENELMSEELITAWSRYEKYLQIKQNEWLVLKNERMSVQQRKIKIDSEIKSLNDRIKYLNNLLAGYIAGEPDVGGLNQARVKDEIDALKVRLNECLNTRATYEKQLQNYDDEVIKISKEIKKENATDSNGEIFTNDDIEEFSNISVESVHSDEYYSMAYSLLENSKQILKDMQKPNIEYKINCVDLSKIIHHPKGWRDILTLGDMFNINKDIIDEMSIKQDMELRFLSYEYSPKIKSVNSITFGNKFKKIDNKKGLSNLGKKTNDTGNIIGSWKNVIEDAMLSNDWVGEIIDNGLNLSASQIRGLGMRNYIQIDEAGIFLKNQLDENEQLYLGSSILGFTKDGFRTSELAMTSAGLIAKTLVGKILLGQRLYITSDKENGEFFIGDMDENEGFGLKIKDENKRERIFIGTELDKNGMKKATFRLTSKTGRELVISEDGIISHNQFQISDNMSPGFPMNTYINMDEGVFEVRKVKLFLKLEKYRAFEKGMASGGSTQTSSSGGEYNSTGTSGGSYNSTGTSGGSYNSTGVSGGGGTSSSGGATTSSTGGGFNLDVFTGKGTWDYEKITVPIATYPDDYFVFGEKNQHGHSIDSSKMMGHTHSVFIRKDAHSHTIGNHTHNTDIHSHSINIPNHSHSINIPNHSHSINIPNHSHTLNTTHSHTLNYGIFEDTKPSNVKIYVNDVLTNQNIDIDCEVDITRHIGLNKLNKVRIESDTNGRIVCNVFTKTFVGY